MPELDDEFAKDISTEVETLEELKADIRKQLKAAKDQSAEAEAEDALVGQIIDKMEVELPDVMVESEIDNMVADFDARLKQQGLNLETYVQLIGSTMEDFRGQSKQEAEKRIKTRLALSEIAKAENIEVADEDLEKEYEKIAAAVQRLLDRRSACRAALLVRYHARNLCLAGLFALSVVYLVSSTFNPFIYFRF